MKTKYGNAEIYNDYYVITSRKENNNGKYLHRLIFEDYHNCKLDENDVIHHIDNDPLNNHPTNLICMSRKAHTLIHHTDKIVSDEIKQKISESHKGMKYNNKDKINMSKSKNTSTYLNVSKNKDKRLKQGFIWRYQYYEDGKRKAIVSVSLDKLKSKVKAKGLKWKKLDENDLL